MIRLKRKNFFEKIPEGALLVARPSRWGNPYSLAKYSRSESLTKYQDWLDQKLVEDYNFLRPLYNKMLVCYCDLNVTCHADLILEKIHELTFDIDYEIVQ